jgi:hypothetical protein
MATDYVTWMRQAVCGVNGHDNLLEFGRGRLSLKCTSCGHETPGWDIKVRGTATEPSHSLPPEPARRWRFLPQMSGARRLA